MSPGVKPSSGSYEISEHRPPQSTQVMWDGIGIWRRYRHTGGVRVVSGTLGGRKVLVPEGETTRPTSERVREAIFNSLFSLDVIDGVGVLDLFAGSGALGIEALSRGAASATFVETDRRALGVLRQNISALGLDGQSRVVAGDGVTALGRLGHHELVLLDPPYGFDDWAELLAPLVDCVVVIESDREIPVPSEWEILRVKRYGTTVVTVARASQRGEETT